MMMMIRARIFADGFGKGGEFERFVIYIFINSFAL